MKKLSLLTILFLFTLGIAQSQVRSDVWKTYRHEVGVGYGYNSIYAKLGENDKLGANLILQRSTFNANYRFYIFRFLSARANFTHGFVRKNDKSENRVDRANLRVDYKASFTEFSGLLEFHFFDETSTDGVGRQRRARGGLQRALALGVSVYAGVALDFIRPYGEYYGDRVEFKPLNDNPGIDPDVQSYDRSHFHIPVGVNLRYVIDKNWRLGLDVGYRIGFRSYIDHTSGVHYRDSEDQNVPNTYADRSFLGYVSYADGESEDNSGVPRTQGDGRTGYWVGLITLSYRIKIK